MIASSIRILLLIIGIILTIIVVSPLAFAGSNTELSMIMNSGISDTTSSLTVTQSGNSISGISSSKVVSYTPSDTSDTSISTVISPRIQDIPPDRWILDKKSASWYDPVSRTSWRYDQVLKKFYCVEKGWYLITRYSESQPTKIQAQYYYDPQSVILIDLDTGQSINPETMKIVQHTPTPVQTRTLKPTPSRTPVSHDTDQTDTGSTISTLPDESCLVSCPDCPAGTCHDCNQNQICDEIETETSGGSSGGQSEKPQDQIQPVTTPTHSTEDGLSESPQVIPQPTQTSEPEGGISESAQAPILYMKIGNTWTNENTDAVTNKPTFPTVITFESDVHILSISTYHWNNSQGVPAAGTIGLRDSDGKMFGPWQATGEEGQNGVKNARWNAIPDSDSHNPITFKKGTYTVIDSDENTWSKNDKSQNQGFCTVEYTNAIQTGQLKNLSEGTLKKLDISTAKIGG